MTDLTPRRSWARLLFCWLRLPLSRKLAGPPRFMSLPSIHATALRDPGSLSGFSPSRTLLSGFCHVKSITDCIDFLRGCISSRGVASSPTACMVPVYASHMSFYRDAPLPFSDARQAPALGLPRPRLFSVPSCAQHSVYSVGWTLNNRDSHPVGSATLRLAHQRHR